MFVLDIEEREDLKYLEEKQDLENKFERSKAALEKACFIKNQYDALNGGRVIYLGS